MTVLATEEPQRLAPREPRVRIIGDGTGWKTKVYVGDQLLVNCARVEITLDPRDVNRAVLHLVDVEVDLDVFTEDTIVVLNEVDRG